MKSVKRILLSCIVSIAALGVPTPSTTAQVDPGQVGLAGPGPLFLKGAPAAFPRPSPRSAPGALAGPAVSLRMQALTSLAPAALPQAADPSAIQLVTCPDDAQRAWLPVTCGFVPVPLDWAHPKKLGKIGIYFELYRAQGPVESAILANFGGPGLSTTDLRWTALWLFRKVLDSHDLLLIDDRGRGMSNAIDCSDLQHGTAPFAQAEADCAAQLGLAASRYGSGDIAQDIDAVRSALGYEKVDFYGQSYGGADLEAYATRFGDHLRSLILSSPVGTPALDAPFNWMRAQFDATRLMVALGCQRSLNCSADHPFPGLEYDLLVWSLRAHPVEGDTYDLWGNPVHVVVDEKAFLDFIVPNPMMYLNTGEILAAGTALFRGDPVPLLRLGAELSYGLEGDSGDPTYWSTGANRATKCVDAKEPWDWSAPPSLREVQYDAAVAALPPWYFAPFSKEASTDILADDVGRQCMWWERPTPATPIVPPHARYPHVPALVLSGDLDFVLPLEITKKVASLYPDSVFYTIAEAGHVTYEWAHCPATIIGEFVHDLKVTSTDCGKVPEVVYPAVGRFPRFAREASPAEVDPGGGNAAGLDERKVATVAVAAASDAMTQFWFTNQNARGLRGGASSPDWSGWPYRQGVDLVDWAFTEDVYVSGSAFFNVGPLDSFWWWGDCSDWESGGGCLGDYSFVADLTVSGPGTGGGQLHVEGRRMAPPPVGKLKVTGTLGGKQVAVLVPEG